MKKMMKAPIKWAGGKSRIIDKIKHYLPPTIKNYFEPFCGGGSVFLNLKNIKSRKSRKATISDINPQIINLFTEIKKRPKSLIKRLGRLEKKNTKEFYAKYRIKFNKIKNQKGLLSASLFLYLNKTCFSGIYRENSKGEFNVPYGKYKNINLTGNIRKISKFLRKNSFDFYCCDWEDILSEAKKGDFVYLDPPYHKENKTSFTKYSSSDFGEEEQEKLAKKLKKLDKKGVNWMMSNSNTPFIHDLYKKFNIIKFHVGRHLNNHTFSEGERKEKTKENNEVLIINYIF